MGNCTQPGQSGDAMSAAIPQGSLLIKNSVISKSQSGQANNDLSIGMFVNVYLYSKCDGLKGMKEKNHGQ